ncbi:hypothetical protein ADIAG_02332 [Paeniglutamicibacter gangotriensis Lz1y]|uniref:Uncharacterized protein n=1 Tax=Paeniglutamicibacter gangotriensis Lz1y TaxID=1276920 RepID=M7N965_9MICC|nr:hypothetical protein ADIAG_02332 [Paeniglutamicibacter gangotriensis Lz1y]
MLLVLSLGSIVALLCTDGHRPERGGRWRPQAPTVPRGIRLRFSIAAMSVALAYCVGAIFMSLGAQMITEFTQSANTALTGVLLGCSAAAIGITALFLGWCIVGGIAYSFAFTGGLGLINQASAARHRGATLSLL